MNWRDEHLRVMRDFLALLNSRCDAFVLKGGTALMLCYNLDRFSEDIDLDAANTGISIVPIVDMFCNSVGAQYKSAKRDNASVRYSIHYGGSMLLNVKVSYRNPDLAMQGSCMINNMVVYNINTLASLKTLAFAGRNRIRDLYDVAFICNNYGQALDTQVIQQIRGAVSYRNLDYFNYIIRTQKDEFIDNNKLADEFMSMYHRLGF